MSGSQPNSKSKKAKVTPNDKVVAIVPAGASSVGKTRKKQSSKVDFGADVQLLVAEFIKSHAAFERHARRTLVYAALSGLKLIQIKQIVQHGDWKSVFNSKIRSQQGIEIRSAQRYMKIANLALQAGWDITDEQAAIKSFPENIARNSIGVSESRSIRRKQANEWETSPDVVGAVAMTMGSIDFDPTATELQAIDHPAKTLTKNNNGLLPTARWLGNVFVAPGVKANFQAWINKAQTQIEKGIANQVIVLLPAKFDSKLLSLISGYPICFLSHRMEVTYTVDEVSQIDKLQTDMAVVYLSNSPDVFRFVQAFHAIGKVFLPAKHVLDKVVDGQFRKNDTVALLHQVEPNE